MSESQSVVSTKTLQAALGSQVGVPDNEWSQKYTFFEEVLQVYLATSIYAHRKFDQGNWSERQRSCQKPAVMAGDLIRCKPFNWCRNEHEKDAESL